MQKAEQATKLFDATEKAMSELQEFISKNGYGYTSTAQMLSYADYPIKHRTFEVNLEDGGARFMLPISDMDQYKVLDIPGCTATVVRKI